MNQDIPVETAARKNFRYNALVNFLDGSLFWFGYSFIAPSIILPLYISHFTDNAIFIGLVAGISATGWLLPQLFTANWVEQKPIKKVVPVNWGFFAERVPLLLLPISPLLATSSPIIALGMFYLFYGWHAFGAGFVAVGWQDMLAKVIPIDRRGIFLGITTFAGNATGVLGAALAAKLLDAYPFPLGFTISFASAGFFILLSWFCLALVRELPSTQLPPRSSQKEYWGRIVPLLKSDKNFSRYLGSQIFITLGGMAWGFMAVYTVQRWSLSDGKVGTYTTALLAGQAIANIFFGMLGDRKGYKSVLLLSSAITTFAVFLAIIVPSPNWFYLVFALRGVSLAGFFLSGMIAFEFSRPEIRPTYIGLNNTLIGIFSIISPLIGGLLATITGYQALFIIATLMGLLGFVMLAVFVRDPRSQQSKNALPKPSPLNITD